MRSMGDTQGWCGRQNKAEIAQENTTIFAIIVITHTLCYLANMHVHRRDIVLAESELVQMLSFPLCKYLCVWRRSQCFCVYVCGYCTQCTVYKCRRLWWCVCYYSIIFLFLFHEWSMYMCVNISFSSLNVASFVTSSLPLKIFSSFHIRWSYGDFSFGPQLL